MTNLIPIETINALEIFGENPKAITALLKAIESETAPLVFDVTTDSGRKEIASTAYKIARSKTTIDDAGKTLVAEIKKQSGVIDAARKHARDFLDDLKDRVRKPLTDWENEQARIAEEKRIAPEQEAEEKEAARLADIQRREDEIAAKEAAIAKAESERLARESAEQAKPVRKVLVFDSSSVRFVGQAERVREAREEKIRAEAAEKALRDAAEAVARSEREAVEAKERERLATERAAREAVEAKERAEREKVEAVALAQAKAKLEAEALERRRVDAENQVKAEETKRAANKAHTAKINNEALAAFVAGGLSEPDAKKAVSLIAAGKVPNVQISY